MNQFFLETRGKEKVKDLLEEGMRSQAHHRSGAQSLNPPKLIVAVLGLLVMLLLFVR